ncbi:MAG: hypothetical protein QF654_06160 [Alphaproteobacteria bacterium]|jgi:hypothetical protein|nr:hypothetical protein [Alphaproteobacteria bacterium]|tara:strand:+ start:208 stop:942 length:735 start_codon:yes stop_codon:yes gene_type:complete
MKSLTDGEFVEIQAFVDRTLAYLEQPDLCLTVEVDPDLHGWKRHMLSVGTEVAATHDPDLNNLDATNSFWVKLVSQTGDVVGCGVYRVLVTENIAFEAVTHRLFGDRAPVLRHYPLDVCVDREVNDIRGRVGLGGGIWAHGDFRGRGLGGIISRFLRILSVRWFNTDWHVGFVQLTEKAERLGLGVYGFPHATVFIRGAHPGYGGDDHDTVLVWFRRDEILAQLIAENEADSTVGREGETRRIA